MDQLELVFRLLVRLQFMYLQYNVYLSIVVCTYIYIYIYIYIYTHVTQNNLRTPQLAGFARQLGCKNDIMLVFTSRPFPPTHVKTDRWSVTLGHDVIVGHNVS